jgi:hypothetical protein
MVDPALESLRVFVGDGSVAAFDRRPLVGLSVTILAALPLYGAACALIRVPELSKVLRWLRQLPLLQTFGNE